MIEESVNVENLEVYTDIGWVPVSKLFKTIKMKKYVVLFNSGVEIECADNHIFILHNQSERFCRDLKEGDCVLSDNGYDFVFDVFELDEYESFYDISLEYHNLYFTDGILSHNSNTIVNMASRQVLNGYSPLIISLEMSEDALCQRLDSIYSNQDINRIYLDKSMTRNMISSLRDIKKIEGLGKLIVKEFPTGRGTVQDFETFIKELHYRGIYPNPIYVDYIQIVSSMVKSGKRHEDIGEVSKDLRAMGWKYNIPIISVGQLNRSGMMIDFDEVDFTYVGEGLSISADGDFIAILGQSEDDILYESEVHGKIVKNRLGGRVGEMFKWYLDKKSLKMYDESELQQWIDDANKTGDSRKMKN